MYKKRIGDEQWGCLIGCCFWVRKRVLDLCGQRHTGNVCLESGHLVRHDSWTAKIEEGNVYEMFRSTCVVVGCCKRLCWVTHRVRSGGPNPDVGAGYGGYVGCAVDGGEE